MLLVIKLSVQATVKIEVYQNELKDIIQVTEDRSSVYSLCFGKVELIII